MLAGEDAAYLDAKAQNVGAEGFRLFELTRLGLIEHDQRMQIAVAGMKDVAAAQAIMLRKPGHAFQHFGQLLARNGAVHADHVGLDAAHGGEGGFAARPHAGALRLVGGFQRSAAGAGDDGGQPLHRIGDIGFDAVGIDYQDGGGARRITGLVIGFHRFGALLVHELHGGGQDAVGDDGGDAFARLGHGIERRQQGARHRRLAQDLHDDFHHGAEQTFRAGDETQDVETTLRAGLAAQPHFVTIRGDKDHAQEIVGGEAIFQAMQPAGILRYIAADGAGDLAGRIGRVIEAVGVHGLGDVQVGDARFDRDATILIIDLDDGFHAAHGQQDAVFARQRTAGQRGASATRHDRNAFDIGVFDDVDDLLAGLGQHHHQRLLGVGGERIAIEDLAAGGVFHHAVRHNGLQRADNGIAAGKYGKVRRRQFQSAKTPSAEELARPVSPGEP